MEGLGGKGGLYGPNEHVNFNEYRLDEMSLKIFFSQSTFSQMPRIILLPPD